MDIFGYFGQGYQRGIEDGKNELRRQTQWDAFVGQAIRQRSGCTTCPKCDGRGWLLPASKNEKLVYGPGEQLGPPKKEQK